MSSSTRLIDRISPQFLRARSWVYGGLGGLIVGLLIPTGSIPLTVMLVLLATALGIPWLADSGHRVFCALAADTFVALASWWLFGPAAGTDFILVILAAVAGIVYDGWRRNALISLVLVVEAVQIPLHFMAKAGGGLPMFHEPAQVINDGEFVAGVIVRLVVLGLASALFMLVGNGLRQSRRALSTSEATFRAAFEESPIGVALVTEDAAVLKSNRQIALLAGAGDSLGEGFDIATLFSDDDRERMRSGVADVSNGRAPAVDFETRSESGVRPRHLSVAMAPVTLAGDQPGAVVTIEDVTARVEDHQRLEQLVRSKDEFVASVSHELRTPLTAVIGFAGILGETWREMGEDDLDSLISVISRESSEVASIVEDLLVIARADIGRVTLIPSELDLREEVSAVLAGFPTNEATRVAVKHESGETVVWGDPVRFRQIVRNLVSNAVRYGGPSVAIESVVGGEFVELSVVDDGSGIEDGDPERIFEPYVRAHERPTQPSSVGLGLAVARSLARAMGGDLAYVRAAGQTKFVLKLPAASVGVLTG